MNSIILPVAYFALALANSLHELEAQKKDLEDEPEKIEVLFREMIQMSLWFVFSH